MPQISPQLFPLVGEFTPHLSLDATSIRGGRDTDPMRFSVAFCILFVFNTTKNPVILLGSDPAVKLQGLDRHSLSDYAEPHRDSSYPVFKL